MSEPKYSVHFDDLGYANLLIDRETRNGEVLTSFVDYCLHHPEERFWQSLRNWSEINFILAASCDAEDSGVDTFNWEGRNG